MRNLSLPRADSVGRFYTAIHQSQIKNASGEAIASGVYPSHGEFRDILLSHMDPAEPACVLDAGCGATGALAVITAALGFGEVKAVDFNPESIPLAEEVARQAGVADRVSFTCGSVLDLPYEDDSFDLVICGGVIHHTPDPCHAFGELVRVARPGGLIYLSVLCYQGSAFEYGVRLLRLAGRLLPFNWVPASLRRIPAINNFLLDLMYVPMMWALERADIERLVVEHGLETLESRRSGLDDRFRRLFLGLPVTGDGLLRIWVLRRPL